MEHKDTWLQQPERMLFGMDVERAKEALQAGNMILLPTDTVWCVAVSLMFPEAITALKGFYPFPVESELEVLVEEISALKHWVEEVHPRLETLLLYHTRPVALLLEDHVGIPSGLEHPEGGVVFRVSLDSFVQELIREVGTPLVVLPVQDPVQRIPLHFGGISSAVLQQVDYVVKYRQNDRNAGALPVIVRLGVDEELDFIRE